MTQAKKLYVYILNGEPNLKFNFIYVIPWFKNKNFLKLQFVNFCELSDNNRFPYNGRYKKITTIV